MDSQRHENKMNISDRVSVYCTYWGGKGRGIKPLLLALVVNVKCLDNAAHGGRYDLLRGKKKTS